MAKCQAVSTCQASSHCHRQSGFPQTCLTLGCTVKWSSYTHQLSRTELVETAEPRPARNASSAELGNASFDAKGSVPYMADYARTWLPQLHDCRERFRALHLDIACACRLLQPSRARKSPPTDQEPYITASSGTVPADTNRKDTQARHRPGCYHISALYLSTLTPEFHSRPHSFKSQ